MYKVQGVVASKLACTAPSMRRTNFDVDMEAKGTIVTRTNGSDVNFQETERQTARKLRALSPTAVMHML